ncbi:MAG: hypothetical protein HY320_13495, partial [Armatimonadetes bacterium]|nr:hypothetical protein [Armatimonadota bacterium]
PPRPAPAVVAREATPPGEDTLEVERVRGQWSVIRQELNRRRQKSLAGLIADAVPVGLAEGVLHVQFPSATLAEMFQVKGAEHEQPLSEVIYALCGIRCRIQALAPGAGPPPARPASPATPKPAPDAKPAAPPPTAPTAGRELVHDVVDLFDGQIVGDRDLETR